MRILYAPPSFLQEHTRSVTMIEFLLGYIDIHTMIGICLVALAYLPLKQDK